MRNRLQDRLNAIQRAQESEVSQEEKDQALEQAGRELRQKIDAIIADQKANPQKYLPPRRPLSMTPRAIKARQKKGYELSRDEMRILIEADLDL